MNKRTRTVIGIMSVILFMAGCTIFEQPEPSPLTTLAPVVTPTPTPTPTSSSGANSIVIAAPPSNAKLISNIMTTYRFALGLGPELPYNTWLPWRIDNATALWFPIVAEAGKTYSVYWDDNYDGSSFEGLDTYTADLHVGGYLANKTTRLSGWLSDTDSGYMTPRTFSVTSTQLVYIKVIPYLSNIANIGSFALRVVESSSTNNSESYAWYLDGTPVAGQTSYVYILNPAALASGTHRLTAIGTRSGVSFSETYTFVK